MFFSRCSSAGVHGVLVRLFLGGGSMGAGAMIGSPMPGADETATGADMASGGAPGARLLFRAAACGDDSGLTELSPAPGCAKKGGIPPGKSSSCLLTPLDIGERRVEARCASRTRWGVKGSRQTGRRVSTPQSQCFEGGAPGRGPSEEGRGPRTGREERKGRKVHQRYHARYLRS
jgi:hypothetical protein